MYIYEMKQPPGENITSDPLFSPPSEKNPRDSQKFCEVNVLKYSKGQDSQNESRKNTL